MRIAATEPAKALLSLLAEMQVVIDALSDDEYASPPPGRSAGSVGGHVRHSLDHITALLAGIRTGRCSYDRRERGTSIETHRGDASRRLADLAGDIARLDAGLLDREVTVETQLDPAGATMLSRSSVSRELAFVISHTIHHNATIAVMLQAHRLSLPPRFGLAPSTPPC